jgi:uncharacterized membrane protein
VVGFKPWWALLALVVAWGILLLRQIPCLAGGDPYENMCYTDITELYFWRGLRYGEMPIIEAPLEYPVLSAAIMELARRLLPIFGARSAPDATTAEVDYAGGVFFGINAVLVLGLLLLLVWAQSRMSRPRDALLIALSPAIVTVAVINWDALAVALTALALLAWAKRATGWAGVFLGLGVAAKLYPLLFFLPLAVLCLRAGKLKDFFRTAAAAVVAWVAVNLPFYLANPQNWLYFWTFNDDRGADLGSVWLVLSQLGQKAGDLSRAEMVLLVLAAVVISAVLLAAPKRPRLAQGCFLILTAFLMVNKVYSPQYVLWLLPLLVLANPRRLDWLVFSVAETAYFAAVWCYFVAATNGTEYRFYWFAIAFRVLVQLWLCGRVINDLWHPGRDPLRAGSVPIDDPDGGVLDHSADAVWLVKLRQRFIRTLHWLA